MESPVLFLIFKREETTQRVFERIREAKPPRLYIAADGPRKNHPDEKEKCLRTRHIVENVDWPCEVFTLFREENLGCGRGVSSAITWFFKNEEQGIILEDDVLPHVDFFRYCDELLEKYKNDERIQLIAGFSSFYKKVKSDSSYYMSSHLEIWGWGSWRRVWSTYEYDLNLVNAEDLKKKIEERLPSKNARFFERIYDRMINQPIDTWDYQFIMNQFLYERYSIIPYVNLVENIGFGTMDAAHNTGFDSKIANHKASSIYPIRHPQHFSVDLRADKITMKNQYEFEPSLLQSVIRKVSRVLKRVFWH